MTVKQLIEKNHDYILEMRRELHRHPELSCQEERTSRRICEELEKMGIFHTVVGNRNVVGIINPGAPGKRIAIRGDIDALPITEETGLPFASENPGVMHACGHSPGHRKEPSGDCGAVKRKRVPVLPDRRGNRQGRG